MSEPSIVFYPDKFWISPYVFSVFVALTEKGLAFDARPVSLGEGEQLRAEFRDRTLTARIPAIEHDGFFLAESSAIIEYLDEAFAPPKFPRLLPDALRDRARARQIIGWIRSDLDALREERPTNTMFYDRATSPLSERGEAAKAKLLRVAEALILERPGPLFGAFAIADADLAFMLHRLLLNGHDVPARVRAYAEAIFARPSIRAFFDRKRPPYVPYG
jgi:glutathione S-transferase